MGRFGSTRPKPAAGQNAQLLGNSGSGLSQRSCLPAPGLEHFPTDASVSGHREGQERCLCQYNSEFKAWLAHRLTRHRTVGKFCFVIDFFGFTAPKLSKTPHCSLKINSGSHSLACGCLKSGSNPLFQPHSSPLPSRNPLEVTTHCWSYAAHAFSCGAPVLLGKCHFLHLHLARPSLPSKPKSGSLPP